MSRPVSRMAPPTQPKAAGPVYPRQRQATHIDLCLGAVADIAEHVRRGEMALAGEARRTLDELCWSPAGYPKPVREALRAAGLRHEVAS